MAEGAFGCGWSLLFPPAESSGMGSQPPNHQSGINQICSVYCNIWREADGEEIWQGFASIMFGDLRKHDRVARFHTMAVEQEPGINCLGVFGVGPVVTCFTFCLYWYLGCPCTFLGLIAHIHERLPKKKRKSRDVLLLGKKVLIR